MKVHLLILLSTLPLAFPAFAEPDNTCWGDPVNMVVVDIASAPFSGNKAGGTAKLKYSSNPSIFSGHCNRSVSSTVPYPVMLHYVDMGPVLIPSEINSGYYKLSDDVDIRISSNPASSNDTIYFPVQPQDGLGGQTEPPIGQNTITAGFAVAGSGYIDLILRRNIIGGAIVVPSDTELFSAYRVMNIKPYPEKPSRPLVQARTKPGGAVIPIPVECTINKGKTIEVDFGTLQTNRVPGTSSDSTYEKTVSLDFSCNTSVTQDIQVKVVADTASFSFDYIRSDNNELGIALKHNDKVIKPHESFLSRIEGGGGNTTIRVSPVKNSGSVLKGGKFNASATLVILSL
ncbi:fimbrial protein [Serratia inhibens]|uniref:fimbrial protein n=1 Tax=Serratia inhibens TaxID=2338073 RepID=UPI0008099925|nr:fimbrial protein [Serratia inhibens]ANS44714.1 putative fimbrial-like protein SfmH [Serratia inhibens PRI-2C]